MTKVIKENIDVEIRNDSTSRPVILKVNGYTHELTYEEADRLHHLVAFSLIDLDKRWMEKRKGGE